VFLSSINYIVKDISYFSLFKVKYIIINKEFIFNLNLLILKEGGNTIYKKIKVFKLNYN
jgi:hypothetical protein